jgi:SAM-dependent methyltransferase
MMMYRLALGMICCNIFCYDNSEKVFTEIYETGGWGFDKEGKGFSGLGSTLLNSMSYIVFLQDFIKANRITTVVDAGCGDWTFSKEIKWGNVQYLGVDVVKNVIDEDINKYSAENIHFQQIDILKDPLPPADLLICKDVLMHLTNDDIVDFLERNKQYKHYLFTNNVDFESSSNMNKDIMRGDFRPLDITKEPFNVNGVKIFTYYTDHAMKQVVYYGK